MPAIAASTRLGRGDARAMMMMMMMMMMMNECVHACIDRHSATTTFVRSFVRSRVVRA
jgi:hypothetical protein|tara:strand:- start:533 stop:706 length:174 start_codon:yes stop_codon:yes gene_type:complete